MIVINDYENHDGDVMMTGCWWDRSIPQSLTDRWTETNEKQILIDDNYDNCVSLIVIIAGHNISWICAFFNKS